MKPIPLRAFRDNYIWVINDKNTQSFDCVDPGDAEPVLHYARQQALTLRSIFLTHHHHDHVGGVARLVETQPELTVYGPRDTRIPHINQFVSEGDEIKVGQQQYKILETPGHTSSHISYIEINKHWLFCGDTLFSAGCGRVFDGSMEALFESLQRYQSLSDETEVYCAHEYTLANLKFAEQVEPNNEKARDYQKVLSHQSNHCSLPSTIKMEKEINPFFRLTSPEVLTHLKEGKTDLKSPFHVFKLLREMKDQF